MNYMLDTINGIIDNMEKVIIGKRKTVELVVISLISRGHVLVEDVPGVGKTSLVSALAKSVNCSFKRIQFTPDIMPSDITGFSMFNRKTGEFEYRSGAVMSQFLLADEINRASAKTQSSLLEVMQENQVTVDGETYHVPKPFMVIATQNPIEYLGTYPLPEAQLDRFFMRVSMGYPGRVNEERMLALHASRSPMDSIKPVATDEQILEIQNAVSKVYTDDKIFSYIVSISEQTRDHPDIELGVSPRASIALHRAAQSLAFCSGRDYILPDDVQNMAEPVLSHRIIIKREAKVKNINPSEIIKEIVTAIPVPGMSGVPKKH